MTIRPDPIPLRPDYRANPETSSSREFVLLAKALMQAKGRPLEAAGYEHATRRIETICKAAIDAGTLADATWAGSLGVYREINAAYSASLAPHGAFDAVRSAGAFLETLPNVRTAVAVLADTITDLDDHIIDEGEPSPISQFTLTAEQLPIRKVQRQVVFTRTYLKIVGCCGSAISGE
jgi:hypothetical protein